jgi:hypothetical protein
MENVANAFCDPADASCLTMNLLGILVVHVLLLAHDHVPLY